jgi:hypothetical protein
MRTEERRGERRGAGRNGGRADENGGKTGRTGRNGGRAGRTEGERRVITRRTRQKGTEAKKAAAGRHREAEKAAAERHRGEENSSGEAQRGGESRSGEAQRGEESSSGEARKPQLGGGSLTATNKKKHPRAADDGEARGCHGFRPVPLLFRGRAGELYAGAPFVSGRGRCVFKRMGSR